MSSEAHAPELAHHFENLEQQTEAKTLGLWMFLASEILFFGSLFTAYAVNRLQDPEAFALAASKLNSILGGINTAVLLTSSFTMALAVWSAEVKKQNLLRLFLGLTLVLAGVFLVIKGYEWYDEYTHHLLPGASFGRDHDGNIALTDRGGAPVSPYKMAGMEMAMVMYFIITGLHGLHVIIGMLVLGTQWWFTLRYPAFGVKDSSPIELSGLYWHFVDVVWIFVLPVLYLFRN